MLCEEKLTKEQCIALQLSHNSIVGKDNNLILKELYYELENIDWKKYSGLTDDFIEFCNKSLQSLNVPSLKYQMLILYFLPEEIHEISATLIEIEKNKNSYNILSSMRDYDLYLETTNSISKLLNIKNPSTTFLYLIKLAYNHLEDLKEISFCNNQIKEVPINSLINKECIDMDTAQKLDKIIKKMIDNGEIKKTHKELVIKKLVDFYLS